MNYNETDVDCGGSLCPSCELGDVSRHVLTLSIFCTARDEKLYGMGLPGWETGLPVYAVVTHAYS